MNLPMSFHTSSNFKNNNASETTLRITGKPASIYPGIIEMYYKVRVPKKMISTCLDLPLLYRDTIRQLCSKFLSDMPQSDCILILIKDKDRSFKSNFERLSAIDGNDFFKTLLAAKGLTGEFEVIMYIANIAFLGNIRKAESYIEANFLVEHRKNVVVEQEEKSSEDYLREMADGTYTYHDERGDMLEFVLDASFTKKKFVQSLLCSAVFNQNLTAQVQLSMYLVEAQHFGGLELARKIVARVSQRDAGDRAFCELSAGISILDICALDFCKEINVVSTKQSGSLMKETWEIELNNDMKDIPLLKTNRNQLYPAMAIQILTKQFPELICYGSAKFDLEFTFPSETFTYCINNRMMDKDKMTEFYKLFEKLEISQKFSIKVTTRNEEYVERMLVAEDFLTSDLANISLHTSNSEEK